MAKYRCVWQIEIESGLGGAEEAARKADARLRSAVAHDRPFLWFVSREGSGDYRALLGQFNPGAVKVNVHPVRGTDERLNPSVSQRSSVEQPAPAGDDDIPWYEQ